MSSLNLGGIDYWKKYSLNQIQGSCFNSTFGTNKNDKGIYSTYCVQGSSVSEFECINRYNGDWAPSLSCPQLGFYHFCANNFINVDGANPPNLWSLNEIAGQDANQNTLYRCSKRLVPICSPDEYDNLKTDENAYRSCPCIQITDDDWSKGLCPSYGGGNANLCIKGTCNPSNVLSNDCLSTDDCENDLNCVAKPNEIIGTCSGRLPCVAKNIPGAKEKITCPPGQFCNDDNFCKVGCRKDFQCEGHPDGLTQCNQQICVAPTCVENDENSICPPQLPECKGNVCTKSCDSNDDCSPGYVCSQTKPFVCGPACEGTECGGSQICNGGACISGCLIDSDCAGGICRFGQCTIECVKDSDCDNGYCGSDNICIPFNRSVNRGKTQFTHSTWFWLSIAGVTIVIAVIAAILIKKHHNQAEASSDVNAVSMLQSE